MGQYTIVADASVFQGDAGTYRVESLNLLKIRLTEIPAIAYLENVSKTGVFAGALAQSAERPVADAANMVTHPMDTVTGLPSGIGSLFGRVSLGVGTHSFDRLEFFRQRSRRRSDGQRDDDRVGI